MLKWTSVWPLSFSARKKLRCLERWIRSCWLVPWMLIFVVNIKCTPSMFISGRVFGKWNNDLCLLYSGSSLGFFWELLNIAEVEAFPAAGEMFYGGLYCCLFYCPKLRGEQGNELRACNSARSRSRNIISAEVWWITLQNKEALSNLKEQDWTNLRSENELKTL